MKTCLFVVLVAAFVAAMTACAGSQWNAVEGSPSPSNPSTVTKSAATKAAWEQKWETTVAAARKEGQLLLLNTGGEQVRANLVAPMRDRFGIALDVISGSQNELLQKISTERRAGLYLVDLTLFSPTTYIDTLKPQGMVSPVSQYLILPDVKDTGNWIGNKFPMFDKDGTVVAIASGYQSYIFYNTDLVKEGEIRSYRDLLNPKWKGKMVMLDPTAGASPSETFVNYFIPRIMGTDNGQQFLKDLVKQDITYTTDRRQHVEWVAKGKFPVGIAGQGTMLGDFITAKAPITRVRAEEGGLLAYASSCMTVVDRAPHPNAATIFLNWALTEEGQRLFAAGFNYPPRRLGVPFDGSDEFAILRPGEKAIESDEAFYVEGKKTANWAKDIFGSVVGK